VKKADAVSPAGLPDTMTEYEPAAVPGATVNEAETEPVMTVQVGDCSRSPGTDESEQAVSVVAKSVPETATIVPMVPESGVRVIAGSGGTVKVASATRPLGVVVI
jgi:hypothetical protein